MSGDNEVPVDVRLVWGPSGARSLGTDVDVAVVVDVLSFTTTVSVAADRGVTVLPCAAYDVHAATLAVQHDAVLAVRRSEARPGDVSLSPGSVRAAASLRRLVLPSPNGSTLSRLLGAGERAVVAASLRNAASVAAWIAATAAERARPLRVALVPAGERRADGSVRQAPEDVWGAGAVLEGLTTTAPAVASPRAAAALTAWREVARRPGRALRLSRTGVELTDAGFASDVAVAAEVGTSVAVPLLRDGAYVDVTPLGR
ncbi:2-phosphosulfolactate phosphatase [Cellulomonas algicola]|uniref:Probable 2-phosphosulfolactate phosphatase n=1 Tax=Cellulomonas algicola TaxID=2071633 RepID=A0A401UZ60_9CELL|nr:2-phosphosulfolactate phosphatase [Cellulomonas algicola]GCD19977.1 hypothetical protein CTKZ_15390 [Cellulomonas algicola]